MSKKILTTCKNCNNEYEGKFCNECGQAKDTHRLSMHHIWHDLQHGLLHFDNGIFYSLKQLFIRPGHTIREYLDGKRVKHFKPVSFVVILATIYGLISHFLIPDTVHIKASFDFGNLFSVYEKVINWTLNHFAIATLLLVISTTIASYITFKKQGYNVAEHLALNAYYRGFVLPVSILFFIVLYFQKNANNENFNIYIIAFQFIDFLMMYWCYSQFFNKMKWYKSLGLTVVSYFFMSILNMIIAFLAGLFAL